MRNMFSFLFSFLFIVVVDVVVVVVGYMTVIVEFLASLSPFCRPDCLMMDVIDDGAAFSIIPMYYSNALLSVQNDRALWQHTTSHSLYIWKRRHRYRAQTYYEKPIKCIAPIHRGQNEKDENDG